MSFAVIGLGFGDEGKGMVTDYLCSQNDIRQVIRYSGGQQAGHTVDNGNTRHIFSNFGSGTLRGIPTFWSETCTFDPVAMLRELEVLKSKGVRPVLRLHANAPVSTPYDRWYDRRVYVDRGGSCGLGVGATKQRESNYMSLVVRDLQYPKILEAKLESIAEYYGCPSGLDKVIYDFKNAVDILLRTFGVTIVNDIMLPIVGIENPEHAYIYEGSQGLMLDQNIGVFPYVTRSNVGSLGMEKARAIGMPEVYYVTRAYQTRHGKGPMTNEEIKHNIAWSDQTNITNEYQGEFRVSLLDIDLLEYAMLRDIQSSRLRHKTNNLVITCMDQVETDLRYTRHGEVHEAANAYSMAKHIALELNTKVRLSKVFVNDSVTGNFKEIDI